MITMMTLVKTWNNNGEGSMRMCRGRRRQHCCKELSCDSKFVSTVPGWLVDCYLVCFALFDRVVNWLLVVIEYIFVDQVKKKHLVG